MTGISEKQALRHAARQTRKVLMAAAPDFAQAIAHHACAIDAAPGSVIGGYHALPEEADPSLLLETLVQRGCHIAFPRIAGKGAPLAYHRVPDGEALAVGGYGIHEPLEHWPPMRPDLLLVPLLAFDGRGHRLGYGGGFYDRTIAALSVPAVGIAYAGQQIARLPDEAHDQLLAAVLTEQGFTRFRA
jgi:5-formyltetrahydrofolate cyclo-ligase